MLAALLTLFLGIHHLVSGDPLESKIDPFLEKSPFIDPENHFYGHTGSIEDLHAALFYYPETELTPNLISNQESLDLTALHTTLTSLWR